MATTLFAACIGRLGLSQPEASELLGVNLQNVKNWCVGRSKVPSGIWPELRHLEARVTKEADALYERWKNDEDVLNIAYADPIERAAMADFVLHATDLQV